VSAAATTFALIGVLCTSAFVIGVITVVVASLLHDWRTAKWVFRMLAFDPGYGGEVWLEVEVPRLIPWRVAKRWVAPRAYRRLCIETHCDPIDGQGGAS
jgi:hypothetical protein